MWVFIAACVSLIAGIAALGYALQTRRYVREAIASADEARRLHQEIVDRDA